MLVSPSCRPTGGHAHTHTGASVKRSHMPPKLSGVRRPCQRPAAGPTLQSRAEQSRASTRVGRAAFCVCADASIQKPSWERAARKHTHTRQVKRQAADHKRKGKCPTQGEAPARKGPRAQRQPSRAQGAEKRGAARRSTLTCMRRGRHTQPAKHSPDGPADPATPCDPRCGPPPPLAGLAARCHLERRHASSGWLHAMSSWPKA